MTAIPHAAEALTSASGRFELASSRLLEAASGADSAEAVTAIAQMIEAKTQFFAGAAIVRFSDEMLRELIAIAAD